VVGARGSPLSAAQTAGVIRALEGLHPGRRLVLKTIRTSGDDTSLDLGGPSMGGTGIKGLFVKEIEAALLDGSIDLAVHSAKDMPFELPPGLALGPVPERGPAWDALCLAGDWSLDTLPPGARVGTSSLRRRALMLRRRPDLAIVALRGNVATRLAKMMTGLEAAVLAEAGLVRLPDLASCRRLRLPPEVMTPAPGQGILAVEVRAGDRPVLDLLRPLGHGPTTAALAAERAFMGALGAGCRAPAAAWARPEEGALVMEALVADPDGRELISARGSAGPGAIPKDPEDPCGEAAALGRRLAEEILARGGDAILAGLADNPPGGPGVGPGFGPGALENPS
jgi:hydroxymethylbilane synthase